MLPGQGARAFGAILARTSTAEKFVAWRAAHSVPAIGALIFGSLRVPHEDRRPATGRGESVASGAEPRRMRFGNGVH